MTDVATGPRTPVAMAAGIILLFMQPLLGLAHGPFHERLAETNRLIAQYPDSAALYLHRGELFRHHADWREALADYKYAENLGANPARVDWCRGQLLFEAGRLKDAKQVLDRLLKKAPSHGDAFLTRAQVLVKLGEPLAAAEDFSRAISHLIVLQPEYYLQRAQALARAGAAHIPAALHGLDEGLQQLGPLAALQLYAIELEIKQKDYAAALQRLEKIQAQSPKPEAWLWRRGEILQMAGRHAEATDTFKKALQEIESLPLVRRQVKATMDLEKRLRAMIQEESHTSSNGKN